jgi:hypothetical protein
MRAAAYPAESPSAVALPEERMDIHVYLFEARSRGINGQALDATTWQGPGV